jgi:hypothetical protein
VSGAYDFSFHPDSLFPFALALLPFPLVPF